MKLEDYSLLENMPNKFYTIPTWCEDEEKHKLHDCFDWKNNGLIERVYRDYGKPTERIVKQYYGTLKMDILDSNEKLIYYLKGAFGSAMIGENNDEVINLHWANGHQIIERIQKAISKLYEFTSKAIETKFLYGQAIKSIHHEYCIPICNRVEFYKDYYNLIMNFK